MKNEYSPIRPLRRTIPGDVITLGAQDGAAEPVQCASSRESLDVVWQHAFSTGTVVADQPGFWLVDRGSRARVLKRDRSPGFRLECAEIKILSGTQAGKVGWIATPAPIDPLCPSIALEQGAGVSIEDAGCGPTLVATAPDALDELAEATSAHDDNAIAALLRMNRAVSSGSGFAGRVQNFDVTPRRRLSCAKIELLDNSGSVRTGWILAAAAKTGGSMQ